MRYTLAAVSLAGLALASTSAMADGSYSGGGGAIPDNGGAGTPLVSNIVVGDSFTIDSVTFDLLNMSHTFVGDLIITLTHVDSATSVVLVDQPGAPEFSSFGWAYNLGGDYSFSDDGAVTWHDVNGGVQDTDFNIASGTYLGENLLSAFAGVDSAGTWRLTISDNAGFDTGSLGNWQLNLNSVPAPSGLALIGLGGLAATRRRRV